MSHTPLTARRLPPVLTLLLLTLTLGVGGAVAQPVLNEIYFHPPQPGGPLDPTGPEDLSREWIEIHHSGLDDLSLTGWKIGRGITFTFAAGQTLPAGGYAVVCANEAVFAAAHPGVRILRGVWTGDLSNIDDALELTDPSGTVVDAVHYGTDGDWAVRRNVADLDPNGYPHGWTWLSAADGGGKSLELVNPARPHDAGQNWRPSVADGGTPGAANSRASADAAPFILKTKHHPVVPTSGQSVRVTAEVTDETATGLTVNLKWRVSALAAPAFSSIPMRDDGLNGDDLAGDSVFTAAIPAQAHPAVVEYHIEAVDAAGQARSWPAPSNDEGTEHLANALYQVDDASYVGQAPLYRIVMPAAELDALDRQRYSGSNRTAQKYLCAFVTDVLGSVEVRQQSGIRIRGNGSRSARPRSVRVDFLDSEPWQNNTAVNINGRYTYLQTIGARLAQAAGVAASDALPVSVRFNGQNRAAEDYRDPLNGADSGYGAHFGLYASVEPINRDYIKHHFPDFTGANLYTKRGQAGAEWRPAGEDAATWPTHYIGEGWEKQNNTSQLDFADLHHFISVMNVNEEMRGPEYLPNVSAVLDLPQWLRALAVETFLTDGETKIFNGRDDDYSLLRGPDGKMRVLTHDFDTILGSGDSSAIGLNRLPYTLFDIVEEGRGGDIFDKLIPLFLQPEVLQDYYRQLRGLLVDGPFAKAPFDALVTRELDRGGWPSSEIAAVRNSVIAFADARRADILSQISPALTATAGLTVVSGYERAGGPDSGPLRGTFDAAAADRVLVNGVPAELDFRTSSFTAPSVVLFPGLNRVTIQETTADGGHLRRIYFDIWREAEPVVRTGAIPSSVTWTAEGGPWQVNGEVTIGNGVTLTLQAGATVYMGPGASLTVSGTGRLVAEGAPFQRIRFTRRPGTADAYGAISLVNAANESRLVHCDLEFGGGKTIGGHHATLHVNRSKVLIDHCTFTNSDAQYFCSDAGAFIVSHSYFQTYTQPAGWPPANGTGGFGRPEMLHGVNGLMPGGYGIFKGNLFGHTYGFNDVIDYTGGNRPGPVLQFIDNIFTAATDDCLDLDSTDAFISGNVFLNVHQDPARSDTADTGSAISGGMDNSEVSEWTIYGNLFYHVDHAVLAKGVNGGANSRADRFVFLNNTIHKVTGESPYGNVGVDIAAFNFSDDGAGLPPAGAGAGALIAHNVISGCDTLVANYDPAKLSVTFEGNVLPVPWTGPGSGNVVTPSAGLRPEKFAALDYDQVERADDYTRLWRLAREAFALSPGSPGLGTGPGGGDRGGLIFNGVRLTGVPAATTALNSATITVGPSGSFNPPGSAIPAFPYGFTAYQWKLDGGAFSADVPSATPITLTNLAPGTHTLQVIGKNDAGGYQAAPTVAVWTVDPGWTPPVRINEVLASNATALSSGAAFPDAVELFNPGAAAVDLSGWMLSDDAAIPDKFVFPAGSSLAAGGYLVLIAGPLDGGPGPRTGFALDADGDDVILTRPAAGGSGGGVVVDRVSFGRQLTDLTIGRTGPDGASWDLTVPTLGAANVRQPTENSGQIRINEWLAGSVISYRDDLIELYNPSPLPAAFGGWIISDTPGAGDGTALRPLSFIAGQGFAVLRADGSPLNSGGDHLPFKLSAFYDWIVLTTADGALVDQVPVGREAPDVSHGRLPDGSANIRILDFPSPGLTNVNGVPPQVTETVTSLLPWDTVWQYRDDLDDVPPDDASGNPWISGSHSASGWKTGLAPLGRDTGLDSLPNPGTGAPPFFGTTFTDYTGSRISYYFRGAFTFAGDPAAVTSLRVSRWIDDGYLLYLNGRVIDRKGLSGAPPLAWSDQASNVGDASAENGRTVTLPAGVLLAGSNQLAAEVHQSGGDSSDITFAVKLEAVSVTATPGQPDPARERLIDLTDFLRVTEVMFAPALGGSENEFVELRNLSSTLSLDLTGVRFTEGIDFVFPALALPPGGYVLVVRNLTAFRQLYGHGPVVAGVFGGRLDNSGETLTLTLPAPWTGNIQRFRYEPAWFPPAAGAGFSLEAVSPPAGFETRALWNEKSFWQASALSGGTPGGFTSGGPQGYAAWLAAHGLASVPEGDADGDGLTHPMEYALGLNPLLPDTAAAPLTPGIDGTGRAVTGFSLSVNPPADVTYTLEAGGQLSGGAWTVLATRTGSGNWSGPATVQPGAAAGGRVPFTVTDPAPPSGNPRRFVRLRVTVGAG